MESYNEIRSTQGLPRGTLTLSGTTAYDRSVTPRIDNARYPTSKDDSYYRIYEREFAAFADQEITLLELGIDRGGSLLVWRDFFSRGTIVGLDKGDASVVPLTLLDN